MELKLDYLGSRLSVVPCTSVALRADAYPLGLFYIAIFRPSSLHWSTWLLSQWVKPVWLLSRENLPLSVAP